MRVGLWTFGAWALFFCLCSWSVSEAQALEVRVRGQGGVELRARPAGTVLQLEGRLHDENGSGQPLQDLELSVRRGQALLIQEVVTTGYDGRIQWSEEFSPGTYQVGLRYPGGSHISGAEASATVELEVRRGELAVHGPSWLHGPDVAGRLRVQATVGGVPLSSSFVNISAGGRPPVSVALGEDGRGSFDVGAYLGPGPNHVRVELEGSSHRPVAAWDLLIRRSERAELVGEAEVVFRRLERGLKVTLELTDHDGGIEGARVDVLIEQSDQEFDGAEGLLAAPLSRRGRTDWRGRATVFFSFDEVGEGPWKISAQALPSEGEPVVWPWEEVHYQARLPERLTRWVGLLAFIAGVLWLARQVLFLGAEALRRWLAERRRRGEDEGEGARFFADFEELELQIVQSLAGDELSGEGVEGEAGVVVQVWDDWRGEPVSGATVEAVGEGQVLELRSSEGGRVVFEDPAPGLWRLKIRAPGYVPGEAELLLPGVGRGVRLNLTPIPYQIRKMYRWMVQRGGGGDSWGRLTPRQIQAVLLGEGESDEQGALSKPWEELLQGWQEFDEEERVEALFAAVTALVEETNFSGRDQELQVWEVAKEAMKALGAMLEGERGGRDV